MFTAAVALTVTVLVNGERIDQALLDNQRVAATATRMGALAEEIEKSLLLIERAVRDEQPPVAALYELQRSADRLDQIVGCFNDGGETVAPDNSRVLIRAVADEKAAASLQEMNTIWFGIKNQADKPIRLQSQNKPLTLATMREASEFVHAQAARFAEHSLAFSKRMETVLSEEASRRQTVQGLCNALGMLAWASIPAVWMLNRLRRTRDKARAAADELSRKQTLLEVRTLELGNAKLETDRIMETVQEGLLLMDRESVIGNQCSAELRTILRVENPAGLSLLNLLQRLLTEKMYNTTKDYFALLFDARRKEKTVLKVNPLDNVEVHFSNPNGGFTTRHLGFSFRRILSGETVERVFVAIKDITAQVELERSLREAEKKKDRQLEILLNIIHADASAVADFTELATRELDFINEALKAEDFALAQQGQAEALRARLKRVFASVHNIKGNAAVLGMDSFAKTCHAFEEQLGVLLGKPTLGGDDFLSVVVHQATLKADLGELRELHAKLGRLRPAGAPVAAKAAQPKAGTAALLNSFAAKAAGELGKEVRIDIDDEAAAVLAGAHADMLRDVLIQLTRNALAHSIERPEDRAKQGKPRSGLIQVRRIAEPGEGQVGLSFRDDGRGLDLERIKARAVERGLVAAEEAATLPDDQAAALIFSPGLSTAETAGDHAGRGMGMDIIKTRIVDEAGGDLHLHSEPGAFCEFGLYLPAA